MRSDFELTTSVWMAATDIPQPPPLTENTDADVCVVGAGIAGLTTAYLCLKARKSVVVIDSNQIGGGMTARTSAHLTSAIDDRYFELERIFGREGARIAAESHTLAIAEVEKIVHDEQIDCDFQRVDGYLMLAPEHSLDLLTKELGAAREAGVFGVELVPRAPYDTFDSGPCLRFPRLAEFQPLRYIDGLVKAIRNLGGRLYAQTRAVKTEGGDSARVETQSGAVITCRHIVVATNAPINDTFKIHTKQAPYRTYMIAAPVPRGSVPHVLLWDTGDPYHYVRVVSTRTDETPTAAGEPYDILLVGGEDHKTGQADDARERYQRIEAWARARFPMMGTVTHSWSGQIMETQDGLAFIGRNPGDHPNVYIATGDSGHGLTHGTIAGILLTDLILKDRNPWQEVYDPARKKAGSVGAFLRENLNVVAQYADWLKGGDIKAAEDLLPGQGAILSRGTHKIAAYRDETGELHQLSAACTHLQCVVSWNSGEKTWDCPCHGSRFDALGRVIEGPAVMDLAPLAGESAPGEERKSARGGRS